MTTASSRYWDSPQNGMSPDMAAIARRNLAATDRSISGFNDRAKYLPTPTTPVAPVAPSPVPTASGFQFGLNGNNDSGQLQLSQSPLTSNAVNRLTPSAPPAPAVQSWRFNPTTLDASYKTNTSAYNQTSSVDLAEQRKQYGWGQ